MTLSRQIYCAKKLELGHITILGQVTSNNKLPNQFNYFHCVHTTFLHRLINSFGNIELTITRFLHGNLIPQLSKYFGWNSIYSSCPEGSCNISPSPPKFLIWVG